jgi:hypothetical protein
MPTCTPFNCFIPAFLLLVLYFVLLLMPLLPLFIFVFSGVGAHPVAVLEQSPYSSTPELSSSQDEAQITEKLMDNLLQEIITEDQVSLMTFISFHLKDHERGSYR